MDMAAWMQIGGLTGLAVAVVAGFLFSFTPVAFASISVILAYDTRARSPKEAISYGLAFALGRCIPLVVGAISIGWLKSLQVVERWRHAFEVVDGLVLFSVGLYLMNETFFWI